MNRERKFRAWDGKEMKHEFLVGRPQFADALSIMTNEEFAIKKYHLQEWKVMDWTGLKDINGKDVFEGDILKLMNNRGTPLTHYWQVIWEAPNFNIQSIIEEGLAEQGVLPLDEGHAFYKSIEVIGNIHENPELLK